MDGMSDFKRSIQLVGYEGHLNMNNVLIALGLTVFAGMATGIGSIIAFTAKRTNYRFLSVATGFSAGVMLYVSFVEIFFKGVDELTAAEAFGNALVQRQRIDFELLKAAVHQHCSTSKWFPSVAEIVIRRPSR